MKLLFICSANTDRSPTFHNWFARHTDHEIKSCGVNGSSYGSIVSEELLNWADHVYVMDIGHYMAIEKKFPNFNLDKVEIIGCSDQYSFEEPELIEIVEYWANKKEFETHEAWEKEPKYELPKDKTYTEYGVEETIGSPLYYNEGDHQVEEYYKEDDKPHEFSIVKCVHSDMGLPFEVDKKYVYLGELSNMPEHCIVAEYGEGAQKVYTGYHCSLFKELSDEEV